MQAKNKKKKKNKNGRTEYLRTDTIANVLIYPYM
jgi:hypothetical protein